MTPPTRLQPHPTPRAAAAVLALGPAAALLVSAGCALSGITASGEVPPWAIAVALGALVLGVPHGAVDHLALAAPLNGRRRVAAGAAYLAVAVGAAALVLLAPAPAFVAVLALSVWHFGSGDVEAARELRGSGPLPKPLRAGRTLVLGAVPVLLPLTAASAAPTVALLDPRLAVVADPAVTGPLRAGLLLMAAAVGLALAARARTADAVELAALVALALAAPPLVAFAVYFAAWHAARHTLRLALDVGGRPDPARLQRVLRDGAPSLVVAAAASLAVIALGAPAAGVLWVGLAAVWGLTVPHAAVVAAFDRRRRAAAQSASTPGGISERRPNAA